MTEHEKARAWRKARGLSVQDLADRHRIREHKMPYTKTPLELAETISAMTFGDLMAVAGELSRMNEDKTVRPALDTQEQFASLIWDWAESTCTDARLDREQKAKLAKAAA